MDTLVQTRKELAEELRKQLPSDYTYWQTEYCPMEQIRIIREVVEGEI